MEGLKYFATKSSREPDIDFQVDASLVILAEAQARSVDFFNTTHIRYRFDDDPVIDRRLLPATELDAFYPDEDLGDGLAPQLKLIRIQTQSSYGWAANKGRISLNITRSLFDSLLKQIKANPWAFWLINNKYDGFHYVKAHGGYADTFFFGFYQSAVIWTFSPSTASTKGFLIGRATVGLENTFEALLESYVNHLLTPYVPLMAVAVSVMIKYDRQLENYVEDIITVEEATGFSRAGELTPQLSFEVDELATWSRLSAFVQINIINIIRHHENCVRALDTVKETSMIYAPDNAKDSLGNAKYREHYEKSIAEILSSISVLKMRSDTFTTYATYLKSRIEAQISVIFALLTHEDSVSNLKAAEASKEIAEAAKRDSSAMKTIAFMTMAFLPATFLSAFFAMPVIEWERKLNVHKNGFLLYWAVAIPATAFVFAAWALITKWKWIFDKILNTGLSPASTAPPSKQGAMYSNGP